MLDRSHIQAREKILPLTNETQLSPILEAVSRGSFIASDREVVGLVNSFLAQIALVSAATRVWVANDYVGGFPRLWAQRFGSINQANPESLFIHPNEADNYLIPNWARPELAAWFQDGIPSNTELAKRSLVCTEEVLQGHFSRNIADTADDSIEFSGLVDMSLGARLAAAGPRWLEEVINHGRAAAEDVIWTESRVLLSTETSPVPNEPPPEAMPVLTGLVDSLTKISGGNRIGAYDSAISVVLTRIKTEQASPLIHPILREEIGLDELNSLRRLEDPEKVFKNVDWLESNLGIDPQTQQERVLLPQWADGFFVLIGAGIFREFYRCLGNDAAQYAKSLKRIQRNSWNI